MTLTMGFIFSALALGVAACLVLPLLRRPKAGPGHEKRDIVVYREQLAEVDNDIERGLLTKAQAEAVRTEIHRRMLAVEDAELASAPGGHRTISPRARKIFAALIAVLVPVMAAVLYLWLGSPELQGKPFAGRAGDPEFALASSVADLRSELDKTPGADGYKRLAGTLSMMKDYAAAAAAYQKAIDLGADDAVTWSEMGEAVVLASDGFVVPEALGDFYKALQLDPKDARARFYMGLAEAQIDDLKKAVSIWKGLQKDSAPDAPWTAMLKEHIETYSREGGFDPAAIAPSLPSGQGHHPSPSRASGGLRQ